ncbi:MAG: bifunctional phosphoglucose/phosphomannose isomerase [Acidimicrobiales bacterium]
MTNGVVETEVGTRLDTLGMFEAAAGLPEQVESAVGLSGDLDGLPDHDEIEHIVVLGMGGSGIAGDVLAAVAGPFMPVPVVVCKGYEPPSFVSEGTLCFALSFSGTTEETLEAASTAAVAGARMVVVARGGELGELAEGWQAPYVRLPDGIPMPRAGIGALAIPPLVVLEQVGLFPGATEWIGLAIEQLKRRRDELVADTNPARDVARRIGRTLPIIYGGGELGGVAALRWKNQVNENAKAPAFVGVIPELTHNEVCGWGQHGDVTRQVFTLVELRHDHEHPQVMRRFDLVRDWVEEVVASIETVEAHGEGALAQLFDLILVGDFVSLWLAFQEGVDPGPVPVLDSIKAALAQSQA